MADHVRIEVPREVIDDPTLDPGNECNCFLHKVLSEAFANGNIPAEVIVGTEIITINHEQFGISTGLEDWQDHAIDNESMSPYFTRAKVPEIEILVNEQTKTIWIENEETPIFYMPQG